MAVRCEGRFAMTASRGGVAAETPLRPLRCAGCFHRFVYQQLSSRLVHSRERLTGRSRRSGTDRACEGRFDSATQSASHGRPAGQKSNLIISPHAQ